MKRTIVVLGIALALAAAACGAKGARSLGPVDTAGSPAGSTSPTPHHSTSPKPKPAATGSPTTSPTPVGTTIDPVGALLRSTVGPPVTPAGPETACSALIDPGWTGACARVAMAGGTAIWVAEHQPIPGSCCNAWTARVFAYSPSAGGWYPALQAKDTQGSLWDAVGFKAIDLTGDGKPELVAGFRYLGSGYILSYDIVTFGAGSVPKVPAHPNPADHGSIVVSLGRIDEYSAQFPNGEPECCPAYFLHRVITWDGSVFHAVPVGHTDSAPGQDWPYPA